jgi:tyrosine-protein phosphatase SIW14
MVRRVKASHGKSVKEKKEKFHMWILRILPALILCAGCATTNHGEVGVPITNFNRVNSNIYRGGQPSATGVKYLKSIGIKTVIDINDNQPEWSAELAQLQAAGINLIYVPINSFATPYPTEVDKVQAALKSSTIYPVYIHCEHGQDRTGLMVGIYRVEANGWTKKDAHDEMLSLGFHPILFGLESYFWNREKNSK